MVVQYRTFCVRSMSAEVSRPRQRARAGRRHARPIARPFN